MAKVVEQPAVICDKVLLIRANTRVEDMQTILLQMHIIISSIMDVQTTYYVVDLLNNKQYPFKYIGDAFKKYDEIRNTSVNIHDSI